MSNDHETLADRLNAEPAIFEGCSSSELGMIVGLAIMVSYYHSYRFDVGNYCQVKSELPRVNKRQ